MYETINVGLTGGVGILLILLVIFLLIIFIVVIVTVCTIDTKVNVIRKQLTLLQSDMNYLKIHFSEKWQKAGADIIGEDLGELSGFSVSLNKSGDIVAIGSILNDDNGNNAGHVRIFKYDGSNWNKMGDNIQGDNTDDLSGWSVSANDNGDIIAIGSILNDSNGPDSGQVRIYRWNGVSWNQLGSDINGEASGDLSGFSVKLNSTGHTVAIGSVLNDGDAPNSNSGSTKIYKWDWSSWSQVGSDIDGEYADDRSGRAIDINAEGNIVAIGSIGNEDGGNTGTSSGHTRVYKFDTVNTPNTWKQMGTDIDGEGAYDRSGFSVSLNSNGDILAIGAITNDNNLPNSGNVRIFEWVGSAWQQLGNNIMGEYYINLSGWSIDMNSVGNVIAIGAIVNNVFSGHVRVYRWDDFEWLQLGSDIDGELVGNLSGFSVSLNAQGNTVAIGSVGENLGTGKVSIYELI